MPIQHSFAQQLPVDTLNFKEVEITDSKIPQHVLESPVTMLHLDAKSIEQLPQENFYAALASQKGVDMNSTSLFYKTINLRGFALLYGEGELQLLDGVDMLPPGQGFTIGNMDGAIDLDVEKIEIIPGAGSAIYGPNAFDGLINVTGKNPFKYQGLSAQVKTGCNFIDGKYNSPALFSDVQVRYAQAFKNRFAFKFNIGYANGTDWLKLCTDDIDYNATDATRGFNNPGRDIANIYGDEIWEELPIGANGSGINVSRTGWNANEMLGTTTSVFKINPSVFYKFKNNSELSYDFRFSIFNSNVSWGAWNFRKFSVMCNKVEWKNKNSFIRIYNVKDMDRKSYDAQSLAIYMNDNWKGDALWFADYENAYLNFVPGINGGNHDAARQYADIGMPQADSEKFNEIRNQINSKYVSEDGSRFADESHVTNLHAQHDFENKIRFMHLIAGVQFGYRYLYSHGTMFMDYPPKTPLHTKNYAGYVQAEKSFFKDRLNIVASLRYDKYNIHNASITPRIAGVIKINKNNFARFAFQTGSRNPDPFDQYQYWSSGDYTGIGGSEYCDRNYNLHERAFSEISVYAFNDSVNSYIINHGSDSLEYASQLYKHLLQPSGLEYVQMEKIINYEAGYQCILFNNRVHVDFNAFYSIYPNRIMYIGAITAPQGNPFSEDSVSVAASSFANGDYHTYYLPHNQREHNAIYGIETGMEFNFYKNFIVSGNITWQHAITHHDDWNASVAHVTPLKSNVSISNPLLYKHFGFSINWRWIDSYNNFTDPNNPYFTSQVAACSNIDAQVTYMLQKIKSSIRLGASNLLNHYYTDVPQGSSTAGIYYVSFVFDGGVRR